MITTIAVVGPGAIGGTIAAWLAQVPINELTLCARTPFTRLVVDTPGGKTLDLAPRVLVDPKSATPVDWVITVTKTYDTAGAAIWLRQLVGPRTSVAVVQNGIEHLDRFPELRHVLPTIVEISAERSAPGRILERHHGSIIVPRGALATDFAALFAGTPLAPTIVDDFVTAQWRKLVLNTMGVVNALTAKPLGVVHHPKAAALMLAIGLETIAVSRAAGAKLEDSLAGELVERFRCGPRESVNSLLADRLAGRPMELDARNGVVVRLGERHGIPTPLNRMAVAVLEATVS